MLPDRYAPLPPHVSAFPSLQLVLVIAQVGWISLVSKVRFVRAGADRMEPGSIHGERRKEEECLFTVAYAYSEIAFNSLACLLLISKRS